MTGFRSFVEALEQLLSDAGYPVVDAPQEVIVGTALVLPVGEIETRDSQPDGFTPVCDVVVGAAQTRDYTARMDMVDALDRITTLLWASDAAKALLLPTVARVLVRPSVGGVRLGTDAQPLAVIIISVSRI